MIAVFIIIVVLLLALLGGTLYAFVRTFGLPRKVRDPDPLVFMRDEKGTKEYEGHKEWMEQVLKKSCERVYIRSGDGLRLSARYYEGKPDAPVVVFFHGYRSHAIHDGCGLHSIASERGYHILLCDQRGHGESRGRCLSFGVLERSDAVLWAEYAAKRFPGAPIFLAGISMGAATVLMAASLPLPAAVVGVMADCPYSSPKEIISKVCEVDLGLPSKFIYPLIRLGALIYGGFDPNGASAVTSVMQKTPPILIVHGLADGFVPAEMSERIDAAAKGEHKLVLVEGADHGKSYTVAPELYVKELSAFFDTCIKNNPVPSAPPKSSPLSVFRQRLKK